MDHYNEFTIMIKKSLNLGLLACLGLPALADQTSPVIGLYHKSPTLVALTNATLYTQPGTVVENGTLIINQGRISRLGVNTPVPDGAEVIDLEGYSVYPGFIDLYTDYGINYEFPKQQKDGPVYRIDRVGGNAANGAIHAEKRWADYVKVDHSAAKHWLDNGFTAVQSAKLDGILRGQAVTLSLADGLPNDIIYQTTNQQFGSFDKGSSIQDYPASLMGSIALLRQTFSDANWYQQASQKQRLADEQRPEVNAALDALANVEQQGVLFATRDEQSLLRAGRLLAEFNINATLLASGYEYARLDEIGALNANLVVPVNPPKKPDLGMSQGQDLSLAALRHWERGSGNLAALENTGLDLALTLHGSKKEKFWKNLRLAVKQGFSQEKALAALTTVPANIAGISDKVGQLAPGMLADLVIAKGNIFEQGEIHSVWTQGQEHQLKSRLALALNGDYQFNLRQISHQLSVNLSGKKPKIILKHGDKKLAVSAIKQTDDSVSFVVNSNHQSLRFRIWRENDRLMGRLLTIDNQEQFFTATRQAPGETATDTKEQAEISYISRLSWPNRAFGQTQLPRAEALHLKNATVWTSENEGILENTDVLIKDGRFARIGKNLQTPEGYRVIDANGKHITAGIIDEHSHIAISRGVNEGSEAITSEVRIGDVINPDDIHIYRSLAGGATTAQLLHGSANPIGGQAQVIQLRWGESAEKMKFTQAPPSIKFALGENVKQSNWGDKFKKRYPQTRMGVEAIVKDAFQAAREYEQQMQKWQQLSRREKQQLAPPRRDYRLESVLEVINGERHIHAHSYVQSEILMLLRLAEQYGFRVQTLTHILEGYKLADEIKAHGAGASTFADWWAYKFEVYDAIPQNACLMNERGVLTSLNSDSNDLQRRLNQEAAKSITYCGMSPQEAWKMITINPAIQLKIDDQVGSIKAGKQADFVIWDNDPLSVYAKVEQTWIAGKKYYSQARDKTLRQQVRKEKSALLNKLLADKSTDSNNHKETNGSNTAMTVFEKMTQPSWHCNDQADVWHQSHIAGEH